MLEYAALVESPRALTRRLILVLQQPAGHNDNCFKNLAGAIDS